MENEVMMESFEWKLPNDGNLWNRLKSDAKHLHDIGITAVWIPPAYKADEQQDEGYATYDLYDLGEFNQKGTVRTKYGTKKELKDMVDELHKYHISIYLDTVLNHKVRGDYTEKFMAVEVNPARREETIGQERVIQAWTGYEFQGRNNAYSDFKWHYYHFTGVEYNDSIRRTGVFRVIGENKYWSENVDKENENYDFLLGNDIDLNHPDVIQELNKWGCWVANELNLDGFRMDAVKHMDAYFIKQFIETVRGNQGDSFFVVAEYWSYDLDVLLLYLNDLDHKITLFDVPFHCQMCNASRKGKDFDLTKIMDGSLVSKLPDNAVTFVDNHDSQPGSSLESDIKPWFKPLAYGLILLMKQGYPCIFYGDYYGIENSPSPYDKIIETLLYVRHTYAYGKQIDYFDDPNMVGFVRLGDKKYPDSGLTMLISNDKDGEKKMYVGKKRKGEVWREVTGSISEKITIDEKGNGLFTVKACKLAVWVKE